MVRKKNKKSKDKETLQEQLDQAVTAASVAVDEYTQGADHGVIEAVLDKMLKHSTVKPRLLLELLRRQEVSEKKLKAIEKISDQPFFC